MPLINAPFFLSYIYDISYIALESSHGMGIFTSTHKKVWHYSQMGPAWPHHLCTMAGIPWVILTAWNWKMGQKRVSKGSLGGDHPG